jgi:hypothetical protein
MGCSARCFLGSKAITGAPIRTTRAEKVIPRGDGSDLGAYVRIGSFSEVGARNREVSFAPVSGHKNLPGKPQPSGFTGDKEVY